jgi:hypothetical protein
MSSPIGGISLEADNQRPLARASHGGQGGAAHLFDAETQKIRRVFSWQLTN